MIKQRPININPLSIRLPVPAWVSIMHRLSGLLVFALIPVLLWCLQESLASEQQFNELVQAMDAFWLKALLFFFCAGFIFHICAGIRHLLMDVHIGESLCAARMSAKGVLIVSGVLILSSLLWFWG